MKNSIWINRIPYLMVLICLFLLVWFVYMFWLFDSQTELKGINEVLVDSCEIGCIYSTRFYYNNTDLGKELYECLNYCYLTLGNVGGRK
jgi:flagellar basal body-associated protein FliL